MQPKIRSLSPVSRLRPAVRPESLFGVRSDLAAELIAWYEAVIDYFDRTEWKRPGVGTIRLRDILVDTKVYREVREKRGGTEGRPNRDSRSDFDPVRARINEDADLARRPEVVLWKDEISDLNIRHAVILGGPGSGKSVLSAAMMIQIAEEALDRLNRRLIDIDQSLLPIFIKMEDLAAAGPSSQRAETAINILRQYLPVGRSLATWMQRKLFSKQATWVLDGLDQVGGAGPIRSADDWLTSIGESECRAVVTCRTQSFTAQRAPGKSFRQYDLAPFDRAGLRQFIESWFGEKDSRTRSLLTALRSSPSLDDSCRTPLVATFACIVHEDERRPLNEATRRTDLYERIIRRVQDDDERVLEDIEKEAEYLALQRFAWNLFLPGPERNQFSGSELLSAAGHLGSSAAAQWIKQLLGCRLLIKSGVEARDGSPQYSFLHRTILEFLAARHLATVVNARGWEEPSLELTPKRMVSPLTLIERKSWLPAWAATLNFLCGALGEKAMRLIETLWRGRTDVAWHRRGLALQCLSEVAPECRKPELVDELCRETLPFLKTWDSWDNTSAENRPYLLRGYEEWCKALCLLNGRIEPGGRRVLDQLLGDVGSDEGKSWRLLGASGSATAYHRGYLLTVLHTLNHGADIHARALAAETMGALGEAVTLLADDALPALMEICRREDVFLLQSGALHRLWESRMAAEAARSEQVVEELVHYLSNARDPEVRARVASRIGDMKEAGGQHSRVIPALLRTIREDPHSEPRIRAMWALGEIGKPTAEDPDALSTLLRYAVDVAKGGELEYPAWSALKMVARFAAPTFGLIEICLQDCFAEKPWGGHTLLVSIPTVTSHPDFLPTMLRCLAHQSTAGNVIDLLGAFSEFTSSNEDLVSNLLVVLFAHPNEWVRRDAAAAIGKFPPDLSRDVIIDALLRSLREDASSSVITSVLDALASIGGGQPRVLDAVLKMLRNNVRGAGDALREMKEYASRSLNTVIAVLASAVESHLRKDKPNDSTSVLYALIPGIADHLPEMLPVLKRYFSESQDWYGLGQVVVAEVSKGMIPDRELIRVLLEAHRGGKRYDSGDLMESGPAGGLDSIITAGYRIFEGPTLDLVHVDALAELI